ncbi:hypothetical protein [Xenorhabdus japonica]|uniref:Phage tail protein C-terminal domain-containing protein n=1 Tax=Xenorhabdus japonica TaxID=53341 RepID=A0A1I5AWG8_9GAMM|nr:hypothetical protein [Xenorhabdus japonica]SFN66752.1 hypothetical protein SAMN05421579_11449 [Xenorhabdus japonica]
MFSNVGLAETQKLAAGALQRSGGEVTGNITISTDTEIAWHRNTDMAAIGFKNTGDGDTDSYMWFRTGDNGNEYFKWQHSLSRRGTTEWMSLKSDNLRVRGHKVYHEGNAKPDVAGRLRVSSPIIEIYPDGKFIVNNESEGAIVTKSGIGHYQISGVLGYNSDSAWGVHGGISSPTNNNGLELVYIDDKVKIDGSIMIETFHRQYSHLPERFQNWRIKEIIEDKKVYYTDGEPCDIPDCCRLDVRVQMPEDSIWNQKQRKLQEEIRDF